MDKQIRYSHIKLSWTTVKLVTAIVSVFLFFCFFYTGTPNNLIISVS